MYLCKPVRKYIMVLWRKEFEANDNDDDNEDDAETKKKMIMLIQPARFKASGRIGLGIERIDAIMKCRNSHRRRHHCRRQK